MHNRRQTERATFHDEIQEIRAQSSMHDKEIKRLKTLVEEERNEEFIDELEGNWEKRNSDYENLISVIKRVADEVRDSKRFNVYKQLYEKKE